MRIVACVKPVPDPKHWNRLQLDPRTKTLVRKGIPGTINPLDRNALELALSLRDREGGEVIVVSMAPPDAGSVLKEALAMGADRALLLSDPAFAGADTLATAYVLSAGVETLGGFDLLVCGDQTIDGGTAQVSAQLAEFLRVPNLMHVTGVDAADSAWRVRSHIEHGYMVVEIKPPMVLSVLKEINEPRYVTLMNILEAEKKEIRILSAKDLAMTEPWVGLNGSPTEMSDVFVSHQKAKAEMLPGDAREQAVALADRLHRLGFV